MADYRRFRRSRRRSSRSRSRDSRPFSLPALPAAPAALLIVWGLVWLVCNLATQIDYERGPIAWPIGIMAGVAASTWLSSRDSDRIDWRVPATAVAVIAAFQLSGSLANAEDLSFQAALWTLLIGLGFVVVGLWNDLRFAALGVAVAAVTLAGWYRFYDQLSLLLGIAGGGALILAGWWLRQAERLETTADPVEETAA